MYLNIIILIFALAFAASGMAYLYIKKQFSDQQRQLAAMSKDLDMALRCLDKPNLSEITSGFATDLDEAERKSKIDLHSVAGHCNTPKKDTIPERYRHVTTLVDHGLDNGEISTILQISSHEVDQLIRLSQLTHEHAC
jgi:hypothetical protein